MDEDALDTERIGDAAGMLAAGAAEAAERIFGHIIATLDRDLLDRVRHRRIGDGDKALGHLGRTAPIARGCGNLLREPGEFLLHDFAVERLVAAAPEDSGEIFGQQLAEHQIAVSDRKRTAAAITGGPGIGTSGLGPDAIARAVEA